MEILYANGDSWTAGNGVLDDPIFAGYDRFQKLHVNLYDYAWPVYLARRLQIPTVVNDSIGGGSNDRIIRTTVDFVLKQTPEERAKTLVVIGWTSLNRGEVYVHLEPPYRSGWRRFNPSQLPASDRDDMPPYVIGALDKYQEIMIEHLYEESNALEVFCRNVSLLRRFLESLGMKFLFFSALTNTSRLFDVKENREKLKHFIPELTYDNILHQLSYTYANYVYDNNLPRASCHHPLIATHEAWAEHLELQLKQRKII